MALPTGRHAPADALTEKQWLHGKSFRSGSRLLRSKSKRKPRTRPSNSGRARTGPKQITGSTMPGQHGSISSRRYTPDASTRKDEGAVSRPAKLDTATAGV